MQENCRSRCFNMLLYPDCVEHVKALEQIRESYNYVAILHNRDVWTASDPAVQEGQYVEGEVKKAHYHVIVKFKNAVWASSLCESLNLTLRQFEKTGDFDRSARYLVHADSSDKAEYEVDELEGNLVPAVKKALADVDENVRVLGLLDLIRNEEYLSMERLIILACENGLYAELRRMGGLVRTLLHEHNQEANARALQKRLAESPKESQEERDQRLRDAELRRSFPYLDAFQTKLPYGWE